MPRYRRYVLFAFALLVLALLLMPAPVSTRRGAALMDLSHAPLFALVTLVAFYSLPPVLRSKQSLLAVGVAVIFTGGALEFVQELTGRSANWYDFQANVLGVSSAALFAWARETAAPRRRLALGCTAAATMVLASIPSSVTLWDCWRQTRDLPLIASFEDQLEMSRWRFNHARAERSPRHATAGRFSLRVELSAHQYPGIYMLWTPNDWLRFASNGRDAKGPVELVFDLWLAEGPPLDVVVKVVDLYHTYRVKNDCYEEPVQLTPGPNRIRISLDEIARAPRTRRMDLSHVRLLQFYVDSLDRPRTLYVDNIHLEGGQAVEARRAYNSLSCGQVWPRGCLAKLDTTR